MKKIRFSQISGQIAYNMDLFECKILQVQESFTDGKITAAAARRAFLPLWSWFLHYVNRYNSILQAWKQYDRDSYDKSRFYPVSVDEITGKYYKWFMC